MPRRSASALKHAPALESDVAGRLHAPAIAVAAFTRPVMNQAAMFRDLNRPITPVIVWANQRQATEIRSGVDGDGEEGEVARPVPPPPRRDNFHSPAERLLVWQRNRLEPTGLWSLT